MVLVAAGCLHARLAYFPSNFLFDLMQHLFMCKDQHAFLIAVSPVHEIGHVLEVNIKTCPGHGLCILLARLTPQRSPAFHLGENLRAE
jgi:hypothetical protein